MEKQIKSFTELKLGFGYEYKGYIIQMEKTEIIGVILVVLWAFMTAMGTFDNKRNRRR